MADKIHRKNGKRYYDKRLDKDYSYAQKRIGKMGINDDIDKDRIDELERDNRYLKRKVKSIGITLGIAIRELEKNGYTFNFPGKKRENRDHNEQFDQDELQRQMADAAMPAAPPPDDELGYNSDDFLPL